MDINSSKKCIIPWIHLMVNSNGNVSPCCNCDVNAPSLGNILEDDVEKIWNNENFRNLRRDMIAGIENPQCKPCYDTERLSKNYSKRITDNNEWIKYSYLTDSEYVEFKIRYLDIRFNNVCNFKCRYCNPILSHSWYNDYKKLNWPLHSSVAIDSNGPQLFQIIKNKVVDDLESIFFCGGEPLITDQHLDLLLLLNERKKYQTKLTYISNLSRLNYRGYDYIELWEKFDDVNVHFSLDCIGEKLEYIRHGTRWEQMLKNIEMIFNKREKFKPRILLTVSVFNAYDIIETVETLVNTGFINYEDIGLNVLIEPYYYSCQILPKEIKKEITTKVLDFLDKTELSEFWKSLYDYFLNYMNAVDGYIDKKEEFKKITKELDSVRKENFASTFKEISIYYN